ncbi:MAG TPA: NAD(P)H-dependent oxidoreductase [Candidatus Kapabacteria bacterium]|nr:NAD(P)H-dependent oxidoreductase [Candidatus Kapabacteria bacterium]
MDEPLKIQILIGSTRPNRFSEKPAQYLFEELKKKEGLEAELLDLRDWPLPFFDEPISVGANKGIYVNPLGKKWADKIGEGDGYIMVTPEYNHGYSAVLKNALGWVYREWNKKPVGFVSYGNSFGARAIEQLRQVVIELKMVPMFNSIQIPSEVYLAVREHMPPVSPDLFNPLREGRRGDIVERFFAELIDYATLLKAAR